MKSSSRSRKKKRIFVDRKRKETKHRTEWCANASKYRCMRCAKGSKYMKMHGKCTGPMYLSTIWVKMGKATSGRTRYGKKNGQTGRCSDLVQKMFGLCETETGTKIDELLQAGASGHGKMPKRIQISKTAGSLPRKQEIGRLKDKKKITMKDYLRLWNEFETVDSWHREVCGTLQKRKCCKSDCLKRKEIL